MQPPPTIFPLGDSALTVHFGHRIDEALNRRVLQLFKKIHGLSPHITDVVPAYASLTVHYNVMALRSATGSAFSVVKAMIEPLLEETLDDAPAWFRQVRIPVCYAQRFAPDLEGLAMMKNLSHEEVIRLHTAKTYRVYMIGFLPGFAYMGAVDGRIALARRAQPRAVVPAGSVGIAGEQTGIYPLASPGGWNLIGRTPLKLFDAAKEQPALLQPGDEVTFYPITEDEFENHQGRPA